MLQSNLGRPSLQGQVGLQTSASRNINISGFAPSSAIDVELFEPVEKARGNFIMLQVVKHLNQDLPVMPSILSLLNCRDYPAANGTGFSNTVTIRANPIPSRYNLIPLTYTNY